MILSEKVKGSLATRISLVPVTIVAGLEPRNTGIPGPRDRGIAVPDRVRAEK